MCASLTRDYASCGSCRQGGEWCVRLRPATTPRAGLVGREVRGVCVSAPRAGLVGREVRGVCISDRRPRLVRVL